MTLSFYYGFRGTGLSAPAYTPIPDFARSLLAWDEESGCRIDVPARRGYVTPSFLALASHALGLQEETLNQIREAIEIRDPGMHLVFSKYFPYGARLHKDARCGELLRGAGF